MTTSSALPCRERCRRPAVGAQPTVVAVVLHARTSRASRARRSPRRSPPWRRERWIVVHTCHRVELYVAPGTRGMPALPPLPAGAERLEDVDAARHLISVACGLDSVVFGEDQILHQVRRPASPSATPPRPSIPVLDRLFQAALHAGRRAHTWFDGSPRSLADVALDRIARTAGPSTGGPSSSPAPAGWAGWRRSRRTAAGPGSSSRTGLLSVPQPSPWKSADAVPFGVDGVLPPLAGAIVALAGPWHLGAADAAALAGSAREVIDLSSPPAVPDDLQARTRGALRLGRRPRREPEFEPHDRLRRRLEKLVSEAGREYCQWLRSRDAVPAIQAMADGAEALRRAELEWLLHRLPDLAEDERRSSSR